MKSYTPLTDFFVKYVIRLPFIRDKEQGREFVRIMLLFGAGVLALMIVTYELMWFTEFATDSTQESLIVWGLWGSFLLLFLAVASVQGASYLGFSKYPFHKLYRHWLVFPGLLAAYALAVFIAIYVNSPDVDAAYMLLPLITLAPLGQAIPLLLCTILCVVCTFTIGAFYPDFEPISTAYFVLQQLVLLVMTRSFASEKMDRDALMRRNDELAATQHLLSEASRQNERLRIARNIHDLVGHHVTALSINLEALSHKVEGETKTSIEQTHHVAKELLSKVRAAVSEYRMDVALPVEEILSGLTSHSSNLNIELDLQDNLVIRDAAIAEVILRSAQEMVTNTLKHAGASSLFIQLSHKNDTLRMTGIDDGQGSHKVIEGNGLQGMRERVEELGGELITNSEQKTGFTIMLHIPMHGGSL